jgi:hypothetical protein
MVPTGTPSRSSGAASVVRWPVSGWLYLATGKSASDTSATSPM